MEYRKLGKSGAVVSNFALGTMTFGDEADEATSRQLMSDYVAVGGNFLDTADVYSLGLSEEIIGRWLADHLDDAKNVVLTTKARFPMGESPNDLGLSRVHLRKALEASLTRLGVEHIDLYQMHAWDALTPVDETLRFLDDAISSGKIGYYGFSNYLGWQLTKAVHVAKARGFDAPVTLQPQYNLLVREIEWEIVPAAIDAGVGLLPWSPLGGGWLTGKYKRDQLPKGVSRLGEEPERGMEAYTPRNAQERTWSIVDAVKAIAEANDISMAQVSLAWLADRPAVTSVLLGARNRKQLADNLAASEVRLSDDDIHRLNQVSEPQHNVYPYGDQADQQRNRKLSGGR